MGLHKSFISSVGVVFLFLVFIVHPTCSYSESSESSGLTTGDKELISVMQKHQDRLLSKLDGFVNKLKEQEIRIEKQGEMLDKVMEENATLIRENQEISTRFTTLQKNFDQYKAQGDSQLRGEYQDSLDAKDAENARLKSEIASLEALAETSRLEANAKMTDLKSKVGELEAAAIAQKAAAKESRDSIARLNAEKRALEQKLLASARVSSTDDDGETVALRNKVQELESLVATQKTEALASGNAIERLDGTKHELEQQLAAMERRAIAESEEKKKSELLLADIQEKLRKSVESNEAVAKTDALFVKGNDTKNLRIGDELAQLLAEEVNDPRIELKRYSTKNVIVLRDTDMFHQGRSVAEKDFQGLIAKLGKVIGQIPQMNVEVVGHTDSDPIHTAYFASNWELSTARASTIANLLVSDSGLSPQFIRATGKAHYEPVASNDTQQGKALNRRIEIVVTAIGPEEREIGADMVLQKVAANVPDREPAIPEIQEAAGNAESSDSTTEEAQQENKDGNFLSWLFDSSVNEDESMEKGKRN